MAELSTSLLRSHSVLLEWAASVAEDLGLHFMGLWKIARDSRALELVAHGGNPSIMGYSPQRIPLGSGTIGQAVLNHRVASSSGCPDPVGNGVSHPAVPIFATIPVVHENQVVGVIAALSPTQLGKDQFNYLKGFAQLIAAAIVGAADAATPFGTPV